MQRTPPFTTFATPPRACCSRTPAVSSPSSSSSWGTARSRAPWTSNGYLVPGRLEELLKTLDAAVTAAQRPAPPVWAPDRAVRP